jgi:hypothetical protein
MTTAAKGKSEKTAKTDTLRETYERLKPKWKTGRPKNFKRWALVYRRSLAKKAKKRGAAETKSSTAPAAK